MLNFHRRCLYILGLAILALSSPAAQAASTPTGATVTSVSLTAVKSQTHAPFTFGIGFKEGDVTGVPALNLPDQQVVVTRRWNDGSVKHAIASGYVTLTANSPTVVGVINSAKASAGTNLTTANIQAANPKASVTLGSYGTVNLSDLLATPFRVWISGPEMVEAHYRGNVGNDPTLVVWFHVRLYKNGEIWVRAVAENSYLDITPANKVYVPTITIGGVSVYNNNGASLTHYPHTRWVQDAWIGADPQIIPQHDTAYLKSTKLVPNYMVNTPSAAALNGLYQTYVPYQNGGWTARMGDTGYQDQIGLLPLWDSLYVTSGADARAYKSVLANAKAIGSYPIEWIDSATMLPVMPTNRPDWSTAGKNGDGETQVNAGNLSWDVAHHGSAGYLAYLITGDYFYLETMEEQAGIVYLVGGTVNWATTPQSNNYGTSRYINGQTRGYAWGLRTYNLLAGIGPDGDAIVNDYKTLLSNNLTHLSAIENTVNPPGIGYLCEYNANLYGPGIVAPWQQHFFIQAIAMGSDLQPLSDMTTYNRVRDYMYRSAAGILGDATGYCFTKAGTYTLKSNDGSSNAAAKWYTTWADVYKNTYGSPSPVCGNTLEGASGGAPSAASTGYWGNLLPAIAYAVDHGAPGAQAAWTRLTGATNWQTVVNSGFSDVPEWGVIPRNLSIKPTPVNGVCGSSNGVALTSAPTSGLCKAGLSSTVSGTGPWQWMCAGGNNGKLVFCSAQRALPLPALSLSANTTSVSSGGSTSITWSAVNANSCVASGGWTGAMPISGTQVLSNISASATYMLTCTGSGGTTSQNVTIAVIGVGTNGLCGPADGAASPTAPAAASLCVAGTASAVSGIGPWIWTCSGVNGGSMAQCNAYSNALKAPQPIANLLTGQWLELPNTKIRSVLPPVSQLGSTGPSSIVIAWSGGTIDTQRNRLIVWGGGHQDYFGNEMYALDLPTLTIQRLVDPSPDTPQSNCSSALADGSPTSRHTYDGLAYIPQVDKMLAVSGSLSNCGNADSATWTYDFTNKIWAQAIATSPVSGYDIMAVYDTVTKLVYVKVPGGGFFSYDPVTNQYTSLNANLPIDYHLSAAIDSKRRKFIMIGNGVQVIDLNTNTMTTMNTINAPGFVTSQQAPGIDYDPVADRIVAWQGGSNVYALNMDTGVWNQVATNQGPTAPAPTQGTFGRWGYVPQYGVFALINDIDQNAWIFRLAPGP